MEPTPNQRQCIENTFHIPSAVVAGAGSGKTDTLTRRVVYALKHPELSGAADVDEILAITYTDKAAGELKSRIKSALDEAATPENGLGLQALKVDGAWISTIHGMCSRILKENAFTFGVDPSFEIILDESRDQLLNESIEAVLNDCGSESLQRRIANLFDEYRRSSVKEMLALLVEKVSESPVSSEELFITPPITDALDCLLELAYRTQEALNLLFEIEQESARPLSATAQNYINGAEDALRYFFALSEEIPVQDAIVAEKRLEELRSLDGASMLLLAERFPSFPGGIKGAKEPLGSVGFTPPVALAQCALNLCLAVGKPYLQTLLELVPLVKEVFDLRKSELGVLDNNDLLSLTAQKLTDPAYAVIAQRYAEQFKLVMVDEFQDTNQMQVDMINLVAGGTPGNPSSKLCVVGDAQQSIYRFRNADLAVFKDHVGKVEKSASGELVKLGDNFRSHNEILAFSKGIFFSVFGTDYLDLLHGRDEERISRNDSWRGAGSRNDSFEIPRRVNVSVFGTNRGQGISERAAKTIARDFKTLVDRGASPGDMAILLGKMTHADTYAKALESVGLKCAITGGTVFKDSPQAQLILRLLYLLSNVYDTESLAVVLASNLFELTPADFLMLMSLRQEKKGQLSDAFVFLSENGEEQTLAMIEKYNDRTPSRRVVSALRVLGHAFSLVGTSSLTFILEDILANSGWLDRLGEENQTEVADAFKAIRIVQSIENEGGLGVLGVARRFEAHLETAKEAPGVLSAKGDNFIRIMTIHSSKGLSIPIVAVAETEFSQNNRSKLKMASVGDKTFVALLPQSSTELLSDKGLVRKSPAIYRDKNGNINSEHDASKVLKGLSSQKSIRAADFYSAIELLNLYGDLEEHQRKLYVAFTRSKEALFVMQRKLSSSRKHRQNDAIDVSEAMAELLLGDVGASEFCKAQEEVRQIIPLHTSYENSEYDLDWDIRFEVVPPSNQENDETSSQSNLSEVTTSSSMDTSLSFTQVNRSFEVPLSRLNAYPYRSSWAEGTLSASALKGSHEEGAEDRDTLQNERPDAGEITSLIEKDDLGLSLLGQEEEDEAAPATERGTAFHALCEWAALHKGTAQTFPLPPAERISAMAKLYGLNKQQTLELPRLLERWISSSQAQKVCQFENICPEQPFYVELTSKTANSNTNPLVLQGFIDLLAYDTFGSGAAYVIDYKTGTHLTTDQARRKAYSLQAACYAYALLLQGFERVELDFVFVDQPASEDSTKPSVTHFPGIDENFYTIESTRDLIMSTI